MMGRRTFGGLVVAGLAAAVSGCNPFGRSGSYRFRMTIEAQTPEGVKTGNGVLKAEANRQVALTAHEHEGGGGLIGEAVAIDISGSPVFVLLKASDGGDDLDSAATKALTADTPINGFDDYLAAVRRLDGSSGIKGELSRKDWPMMVRFRDINDPKSVEKVDPASISVTRIMLETTGDAVTTGIEKRLGWLGDRGLVVSGPTINPKLTNTIRHEAFWQGPKQ